jgi:hypothetical protein
VLKHIINAPFFHRLPGRDLSFDEFIDRNALLLGIIEDGEFLLGYVLGASRNAEVSKGFHRVSIKT